MDPFIEKHRDTIKKLAADRGAVRVRLFGSLARGEGGPQSDIDLLVDLEEGRSALALGGLLMDLQERLGRRVDVVTPAALHPRIRDKVLEQAVDL
ncbi:nucleotidyltransferase family protein [Desulfuromonas acetexigens]|uniref:Nucleotidyltransferase family protein n=1 Tax=Trichloromonas acetexigens TaxID=38815 RepID=A0A550JGZ9_9BACT|nr:nucleotidyltransferase family protein [Desulfuromonas acetexigens]TRO82475.1 nucleotidyltransferase family protein [Desulfuromonas acetexigens]